MNKVIGQDHHGNQGTTLSITFTGLHHSPSLGTDWKMLLEDLTAGIGLRPEFCSAQKLPESCQQVTQQFHVASTSVATRSYRTPVHSSAAKFLSRSGIMTLSINVRNGLNFLSNDEEH